MNQVKHLVAVDLGSNSFHLVIAREQAGCVKIVHSQKQRVSLVKGLNPQHLLSQEAINRGVECLKDFSNSFSHLPEVSVRAVATHALRSALNSNDFLNAALGVFPHQIDIISGVDEAELIYQGVAYTQPIKNRTLIIDIGGGSTEVIIGKHFKPNLINSLPLGSGSFSDQFFTQGGITEQQMSAAQHRASSIIRPFAQSYRKTGWKTALGTSGSIKAINLCLNELYQTTEIDYSHLSEFRQQLIAWQHYENIPLKSIDKRRLPLLAPAVAILCTFFEEFSIKQLAHSSGALREGVLFSLSNSDADIDVRQRTINDLCQLHFIDRAFSQRVLRQLQLFNEQLGKNSQSLETSSLQYLSWAAYLHEIGITINRKKRQKHGSYIIENTELAGFSDEQRAVIAALVRCHRGEIKVDIDEQTIDRQLVLKMIQLFRLAVLLTRSQSTSEPASVAVHYQDDTLIMRIDAGIVQQSELMVSLEKEISQSAKAGMTLRLIAG